MSGKLKLAAKCLLGTTLLASGSGGVYYATTHGWSLPNAGQTAKKPATELDALAGAWAVPPAKHTPGAADSSPVARSADVDRYATLPKTPAPAVVVKEEKPK